MENGNEIELYKVYKEKEIYQLYRGMSESMQKAVLDIMITTQEKKPETERQ